MNWEEDYARERAQKQARERREIRALAICAVAVLMGLAAGWTTASYFEAQTFNKFTTGPKATLWDAMWASLRVQARP